MVPPLSQEGGALTGSTTPPSQQNGDLKVARCLIYHLVCICVCVRVCVFREILCQSANSKLIDFRISFPRNASSEGNTRQ